MRQLSFTIDGKSAYELGDTSGFTAGSVLFAGADTGISQDNAKLFWDDSNNRLGIGTASPSDSVHIYSGVDGSINTCLRLDSPSGSIGTGRVIKALTETFFGSINNATGGSQGFIVCDSADDIKFYVGTGGTYDGVIAIGSSIGDATAANVLQITGSTEPGGSVADSVQIYEKDSSQGAGHGTLGLYLEEAVEAIGTFTPSHKLRVWINGTEYHIQLDAV